VAASAAICNDSILSSLSACTLLLLFLISDKSGYEMSLTQLGIYRNEKDLQKSPIINQQDEKKKKIIHKLFSLSLMSVMTFESRWLAMGFQRTPE
jgi:hypothetical protein